MRKKNKRWLSEPEEHDYPAAHSYLTLIYDKRTASSYVKALRQVHITEFKSKDVFRASGLPMLGINNSHVKKNQIKLAAGKRLSPILLVRDEANGRVIVADGYHRMCAVYLFDEDTLVPCKIV